MCPLFAWMWVSFKFSLRMSCSHNSLNIAVIYSEWLFREFCEPCEENPWSLSTNIDHRWKCCYWRNGWGINTIWGRFSESGNRTRLCLHHAKTNWRRVRWNMMISSSLAVLINMFGISDTLNSVLSSNAPMLHTDWTDMWFLMEDAHVQGISRRRLVPELISWWSEECLQLMPSQVRHIVNL